jgi:hypothetical protein
MVLTIEPSWAWFSRTLGGSLMEMVALSVPGLPNVMLHFSFAGMSWPGSARKE